LILINPNAGAVGRRDDPYDGRACLLHHLPSLPPPRDPRRAV
jgi:hypothetical protein